MSDIDIKTNSIGEIVLQELEVADHNLKNARRECSNKLANLYLDRTIGSVQILIKLLKFKGENFEC